jgi:hypothetical protein
LERLNSNPLIVHAQGESHKTDKWLSIVDSNHNSCESVSDSIRKMLKEKINNYELDYSKKFDNCNEEYLW